MVRHRRQRHAPLRDRRDEALYWKERAYTFNTSCFSCHVSQLSKNYDLATDSYHTTWAEPGINCETCHGPAGEHVQVFAGLAPGLTPADCKIVSVRQLPRSSATTSAPPATPRCAR